MKEEWKCYFIEHKETHEWWAGQDENDSPTWTKRPYEGIPI
jgi:hypothetical protein